MLTTATVRSNGHLDDTTASHLTEQWNTAYPTMRAFLTASINGLRAKIQREGWTQDNLPKADWGSSRDLGARLARLEGLRHCLGRLDRGTYQVCTRSPGGFSVTQAYWAVRDVLAATTINDRGLSEIYELAAHLAYIEDSLTRAHVGP